MAVVSCRAKFEGRGGSTDYKGRKTRTLQFEVVTDDPADNEAVVETAVDPTTIDVTHRVPAFGDPHPYEPDCVCVSRSPDQHSDSFYIWTVTCEYDSEPETAGTDPTQPGSSPVTPKDWPANPLLEPAKWRITTLDRQEPVKEWLRVDLAGKYIFTTPAAWLANHDYTGGTFVSNAGNVYFAVSVFGTSAASGGPTGKGDEWGEVTDDSVVWAYWSTLAQAQQDPRYALMEACLSSAKIPFDPPEMTDVSIPIITVTKNLPGIDFSYVQRIKNAVNLTTWRGVVPPRCAKVLKFEVGNESKRNEISYVVGTWEVGLDPDTWDAIILDAGLGAFHNRTIPNPAPPPEKIVKKVFKRFKDAEGETIDKAVPMDGRGAMLDPDAPPVFLRGVPSQQKLLDFNIEMPW